MAMNKKNKICRSASKFTNFDIILELLSINFFKVYILLEFAKQKKSS